MARINIRGPRSAARNYRWRRSRIRAGRFLGGFTRGRRVLVRNNATGQTRVNASFVRDGRTRAVTSGGMIGNRLRNAAPAARGTTVYERTRRGLWMVGRAANSRPRLLTAAVGAPRTEGGGGGTNPSQKAYRNSARYRERHGLGAGA